MITIPLYLFIILLVTNAVLLFFIAITIYLIYFGISNAKHKEKQCPYKLEPADYTDNPEYIPIKKQP